MRAPIAVALLTCTIQVARADVSRCSQSNADLSYVVTDIPELAADTGWFPGGSPAQLRIAGKVVGQTTVAMGLSPTACWDSGQMVVTTPGRAQTGWLDSEYGAELDVTGQIHTSVLGVNIDWQGRIPIPYLPTDLLLAGTTTFDPTALASPVSATSAPTSQVVVVSTNLLSSIIDIAGISGGLQLAVQGVMTTAYQTSSIAVGDGAITDPTGSVAVATPETAFGPSLGLPISANGVVHYEPSLIFSVLFDVKILGIRVVKVDLASFTLALPTIDRDVTLTSPDLALPLAHIDPVPSGLGFATGATQLLKLHNAGTAPLMVAQSSAPNGVTAAAVTIAPGADGVVSVTAADPSALSAASLVLATNDPNHPSLAIALDPSSSGETTASEAGGCSTGGGGSAFGLLVVVGLVMRRRR